jgi:hypothetical protein
MRRRIVKQTIRRARCEPRGLLTALLTTCALTWEFTESHPLRPPASHAFTRRVVTISTCSYGTTSLIPLTGGATGRTVVPVSAKVLGPPGVDDDWARLEATCLEQLRLEHRSVAGGGPSDGTDPG